MKKFIMLIACLMIVSVNGCGKPAQQGAPGAKGDAGIPGINGHNAIVSMANVALTCSHGGYTLIVATDMNDNQIIDAGDVASSAEICHGAPGAAGHDGEDGHDGADAPPTPFSPVGIVNPCGDAPNLVDEVFLKLSNGLLLASFSDNSLGKNTRFGVLTPGAYQTTDGDNCSFTVGPSGSISGESHHY